MPSRAMAAAASNSTLGKITAIVEGGGAAPLPVAMGAKVVTGTGTRSREARFLAGIDETTLTHLRAGEPVTADDVKFSFHRAKGSKTLHEKVKEVLVLGPALVRLLSAHPRTMSAASRTPSRTARR